MAVPIRGAIAAGHEKTAEAGIEMFRLGGNVFDAVCAAVLASFVVEPTLTSAAGGGFLLAHTHHNQNILFDFFPQTPRQKRSPEAIDFYPVDVNFGTAVQEFHIGLGSMAVPGTMGGIFHVHKRLGRLPFKVVTEPAVHYAKTGVDMTQFQAFCFQILSPILLASDEARAVYAPNGTLLKAGERLTIPALAETLTHLAEQGPRAFYQGEIAQQLVKDCQERGGYLTLDDLKHYQVIEREPLMTCYRNTTFLTNPPPSSGGTLIAFALSLLSHVDLSQIQFGSTEHLTLLAQVMRLTNEARTDGYDERLYEADIASRFLADRHAEPYKAQLLAQLPYSVNKWGSTTHVSAIDSEGNAASATTSNGEGSSYMIPGTGIMVNNMLGEADLHPNGFHQWQENVRISSMMAPTIVLKDRQPEIVLGSGGSNRIRTAIFQVISNIVDFNMPVEDAVNFPRVHWENDVFNVEPGFDQLAIDRAQFPFNGELTLWHEQSLFFGGVHAVEEQDDLISGAGDRRRGGAIATYP
ncbi:gamma-glutamyltransferase [Oculatella sp. LEGE 06141]|uniref:gamma-glutamyltransferase n=1 Tax=Oculatella sp. LEGE 06141 TaxID=1828648 RepID=UPI0018818CF6|nr:gamma-glutamyltransferase [Oculatella sp. LEGE 06141]MBE9181049.1 gamma-glutamyltransferase [Oculatella sp. LEGE 06141]